MTRRQHDQLVRTSADLILGSEFSARAYAAHFETQMHGGKVRKWLYASYIHFARGGAMALGLDPAGIW
jgi:hypothetical protein